MNNEYRSALSVISFLILLLSVSNTSLAQVTRYVTANGNSDPVYAFSWGASTNNLQWAIDLSSPGDVIWVAAGAYKPKSPAGREATFQMKEGVKIYGGFQGNETSLNQRPRIDPADGLPSSTTLSGDIGTPGDPSDNIYHVVSYAGNVRGGITTNSVLDGFVITGGNAVATNTSNPDDDANNSGGGIYNGAYGGTSNPIIRNCWFQGNYALFGAGMANDAYGQGNTFPQLINCVFQSNTAFVSGGAIFNNGHFGDSDPSLINCLFQRNEAFGSGGAIYNLGVQGHSNPELTNCAFLANKADSGGAIYNDGRSGESAPILTNCTFQSNTATQQGGAFYSSGALLGRGRPVVTNSIFWNNGGANTFYNESASIITGYCLFESTVTGYNAGTGNLTNVSTSPFVNATSIALSACSPAVNTGNPSSVTAASGPYSASTLPTTDLAGIPRIVGGRVDMGAVEYQLLNSPTRLYVNAAATGIADGLSWATAFPDLQLALTYPCTSTPAEIWVAGGTYKPTSGTDRSVSFALKNGVAIYGGFAGSETALNQRPEINPVSGGPDAVRPSSSTLSGDIGTVGNANDNSYHVVTSSQGVTATTILDGFVITGGNANDSNTNGYGGAMYNTQSTPKLVNCALQGNSATQGGAIYNTQSNPSLTNCFLQNNQAQSNGGAIFNTLNSGPILLNCALQSNQAKSNGGAIYNEGNSAPKLTNCTLQSNSAAQGGAFYNTQSNLNLYSSIVWNNGGTNTFISANGSNINANFSLVDNSTGANTSGPGNLTTTTSPFVSSTSVALNPCTIAINAGDPNSTTTTIGINDLASNARIVGGRVDMGAVEYQSAASQLIAFTQQPASGSAVCVGGNLTVPVSVTGTGPITYQWYKSSASLGGAQQNASLSLSNVQSAAAGNYLVTVTGACNSVTSTAFSLTVNSLPTPTVITSTNLLTCLTPTASLSATGGTSYGFRGPGIVSSNPSSGTALLNAAGSYSIIVTAASGCSALSTTTINSNMTLTVSAGASLGLANVGVTISLTATGASSYQWSAPSSASLSTPSTGPAVSAKLTTAGVQTFTVVGTSGVCSQNALVSVTALSGPDLTAIVSLPDANFPAGGSKDLLVQVQEVNGSIASGNIVITITVPTGYSVSFDNTLTSFTVSGGGSDLVSVDNTKWQQSSNLAGQQISLTINSGQSIAARSTMNLGFTITRTSANSGSASNLTVNIADDSSGGYDVNRLNNVYARIITGL